MSRQEQQVVTQEVLQTQQVVIQRLNTLEQEIREIRKAIVVTQEANPFPEFPAIKQQQQVEQQLAAIEQAEQEEFNCTVCSFTKPIDQRERERERENKNQVYANSVLIIGLRKSKNDGTSQYGCVGGNTFQRWGLSKHEQTNKHKMYIESTTTAADESDNGSELSDGVGADDPLIVL